MAKRKLKPIPEWRRAWRFGSVVVAAICATISGAWLITPPAMQTEILQTLNISPGLMPLLGFLSVIIARLFVLKAPAEVPGDWFADTRPAEDPGRDPRQ